MPIVAPDHVRTDSAAAAAEVERTRSTSLRYLNLFRLLMAGVFLFAGRGPRPGGGGPVGVPGAGLVLPGPGLARGL
ncbi:MAG TPA: hypothetical protein DCY18_03735, partial [Thauera sp.]|nr:hypothetical protein [Thauera sp.]